jgi:hypothetical protein
VSREQDIRNRLRVNRENIDNGLRDCLATPNGRKFIYWLYAFGMSQRDAVVMPDQSDASVPMTFRALGKAAVALELENRCKLVDHRNWLLTLAENDLAIDDGRAQDRQDQRGEEASERE